MRRRLLPEGHPNTVRSLSNLANYHEGQGEYGKALLLYCCTSRASTPCTRSTGSCARRARR
jgi:hypothetical protein